MRDLLSGDMLALEIFLCGIFGGLAIELMKVSKLYDRGRQWPAKYHKKGFYVVRFLIVLSGGILAVVYGVKTEILAVHIGAATDAIIESLARKPPEITSSS